jgi:hypothetical protein
LNDLFIEEAVGQEAHVEVCAEIDVIPFFILNGKALFMRAENYHYHFDSLLRIITAKLFIIKEYASCLYQRMLAKNDHLRNLVLKFPLEFIKAPSRIV